MTDGGAFRKACNLDDIWEGEMDVFEVDGQEVLLVHSSNGEVRAYDPICPHQDHPLAEGDFDGCVLTCSAHLWQFNVDTGEGINPTGVKLHSYPVKIEDEVVFVALPSSAQAESA